MAQDIVMELKAIDIPINNNKKEALLDKIIIVGYLGKKLKDFYGFTIIKGQKNVLRFYSFSLVLGSDFVKIP